jgi:hypothetical protein
MLLAGLSITGFGQDRLGQSLLPIQDGFIFPQIHSHFTKHSLFYNTNILQMSLTLSEMISLPQTIGYMNQLIRMRFSTFQAL